MSYVVGPVGVLGHPFRVTHEVPVRRELGDRVVYAFDNKWLYSDLELVPEDDVQAVVVWDPSWRRTGLDNGGINELRRLWELARGWNAPLVGVYSDWFAAWHGRWDMVGTEKSVVYFDAIVTDPVGAAAMRASVAPLRVHDPKDTRHRPIVEMDNFLSYGRLPTLGGDDKAVANVLSTNPHAQRDVDVCFVGHRHAGAVLLRSYHLEALQRECEAMGYSLEVTQKASAEEMEELLLRSRLCFNSSLGSQLNCRVYEACAAGCLLLTDPVNVANWSLFGTGSIFRNLSDLRWKLRTTLADAHERNEWHARKNVQFALDHAPDKVWTRVLEKVDRTVELTQTTLPLRLKAEGR